MINQWLPKPSPLTESNGRRFAPQLGQGLLLGAMSLSFSIVSMTSCAHIEVKPKDPELIALGNFADDVTKHLLDTNPNTYEEFQTKLAEDLTPPILQQLRSSGACAKSPADAKARAKAMVQSKERSAVLIQATEFPARATKQGLIPIEVKGNYVKSSGNISKVFKFDVTYLIGTNVKTKRPIVASVQIKKMD